MANPQQADFQNLTAALQALQAVLPNTNNALVNNTNAINNPPRRELRVAELPYFYGGSQDPISWLEEFTKSCNANGIADARKIEVVPAYLKGPAASWWTVNQTLPNGITEARKIEVVPAYLKGPAASWWTTNQLGL